MKNFRTSLKPQMRLSAIVFAAVLAACGGGETGAPTAAPAGAPDANRGASTLQAPVLLGAAGTFAILTKSGITDVFESAINGDVGASPITGAAIGLTCGEVKTGKVYSVDAAGPLPCTTTNATLLTSAVGDMELAYTDAAGRSSPNFTELGAGEIGGLTLVPGLYKWGTGVLISTNVTLSGGPNDVFIFQIAGTLTQANATLVTLTGGAQAKNVFWQVAGAVTIGTTAHMEGIVLAKTNIAVNTGASANGRLLAQTAVTLQKNAVTQPDAGVAVLPTSTNNAFNVVTGTQVAVTFGQPMDPATIVSSPAGMLLTFTLKESTGNDVPGTVSMNAENTVATFTPSAPALTPNTEYTATMSKAARTAKGGVMATPLVLAFKTRPVASTGQAPVSLGAAGTFAILTKSGITDVFASVINGDVGASPITGAAIGLTCGEVKTGKVYSVDAAGPLPCTTTNATLLTSAVGDMESAYTDAAGRTSPNFTELGAGEIGGLTLVPGLYKWGTGVLISTNVTLSGGPNDVFIFQIAGTLTQANATRVTLTGGAQAKNVFWQVAGAVTIGTTAHFEGIVLAKTMIAVNTGASANGRLLAQTAVTLQKNAVTQPAR